MTVFSAGLNILHISLLNHHKLIQGRPSGTDCSWHYTKEIFPKNVIRKRLGQEYTCSQRHVQPELSHHATVSGTCLATGNSQLPACEVNLDAPGQELVQLDAMYVIEPYGFTILHKSYGFFLFVMNGVS